VGFEGVDKRIDVLATAIRASMTAADLTELDLAYAPPFSSAKDPVNMAGYVIENVRAGRVRQWFWDELDRLPRDGSVTLLDVRSAEEFREGHFPGAVNIPLDDLRGPAGGAGPAEGDLCKLFQRAAQLSGLPHSDPARVFLPQSGRRVPLLPVRGGGPGLLRRSHPPLRRASGALTGGPRGGRRNRPRTVSPAAAQKKSAGLRLPQGRREPGRIPA
jgi:rhodanese-related sulfurtransferase